MKAESRQIPQKLAARLKFVYYLNKLLLLPRSVCSLFVAHLEKRLGSNLSDKWIRMTTF